MTIFAIRLQAEPLANVGLTVSVSAEEKRRFMSNAEEGGEFPTIDYVDKEENGALHLIPRLLVTKGFEGDRRTYDYMSLLQKGGPIESLWETGAAEITFMFPGLDLRVVNNSQRKLLFSEGLIKVASSESDPTPLPFVAETASYFTFNVLNEGWAPMESCSIKFSIGPNEWKRDPTPQFERNLGQVGRSSAVDVSRELVQAGLSPRWIDRVKAIRQNKAKDEPDPELTKPFSEVAYLAGVLAYSWKTASGSMQSHTVRFRVKVPLWVGPLGGPAPISGHYEAMLRADGKDYAVRIPVSQQVDPGTTKRLLVRLGVPRTSRHHFTLQLRTTRGETVESQAIVLDGLLPPAAAKQLEQESSARKKPPVP